MKTAEAHSPADSRAWAFCILGIIVTTAITALRAYVRITKQGRLHQDDYALFVASAFYVTLASLYIGELPYMYTFLDFTSGQTPFRPEVAEAYTHMMRFNWAVTAFFWAVLWSVKISLLLFFRRIVERATNWMRIWWAILAVTVITFIGCIVSELVSCDSIADFTAFGKCSSPDEQRRQIISLYYAFAADVLTELAIMALPLRVIWTLQMSTRDKLGLGFLFSVGTIAIIASFVRVFAIYAKTGSATPSPAWLGLWAVIECMVAIIVGCIPAISQIFRDRGDSTSGRSKPYQNSGTNDLHSASSGMKRMSKRKASSFDPLSSQENISIPVKGAQSDARPVSDEDDIELSALR